MQTQTDQSVSIRRSPNSTPWEHSPAAPCQEPQEFLEVVDTLVHCQVQTLF